MTNERRLITECPALPDLTLQVAGIQAAVAAGSFVLLAPMSLTFLKAQA